MRTLDGEKTKRGNRGKETVWDNLEEGGGRHSCIKASLDATLPASWNRFQKSVTHLHFRLHR